MPEPLEDDVPLFESFEPAASLSFTTLPVASNERPSLPAPARYGGPVQFARSFDVCGSARGPFVVRGANAGLPTTEPVKIVFTQWSSVEM